MPSFRGSSALNHIDSVHLEEDEEHQAGRGTPLQGLDEEQSVGELPTPIREKSEKGPRTTFEDSIVTFDSKDSQEDPHNWSPSHKRLCLVLYGLTTMCSTFASSIYSPAVPYVAAQYGVSSEVSILGVSLFILGFVPGPILFGPLSEQYGRRLPVIAPVFIFACFTFATATSENLQSILITRFFGGMMASSPVCTVGGGLADLYNQRERGAAVVLYSLAIVAGPTLGPVIGAALSQNSSLGWRWTMYLSGIVTSVVVVLDVLFLPETFAGAILTKKASKLRRATGNWALHSKHETRDFSLSTFMHKNLLLPLKMLALEPVVSCITIYNAFTYGVLYLLFTAVPIIFEENRSWSAVPGSLPFIAVLVGTMIAAAINFAYATWVFAPHLDRHGGVAEPEMRLIPMMIGGITFPVGFFLLGWTSDPSIHWFPSILGLVFIGMSFLLIFQAGINFLIDSYTSVSASAIAANTFLRSIFGAALPLVGQPLFNRLGINWSCTLLGCIAAAMAVLPFLFYRYGRLLRSKSRIITPGK